MDSTIWKYINLDKLLTCFPSRRLVLAGGCFDILHFGHITFLEKAKQEGDILIIALESDEFIRNRKKREPIHKQSERAYILSALKMVDYVILLPYFDNDSQYNDLVQKVKPAVVAITEGDQSADKKKEQVEKYGGVLKIVLPLITTVSTTQILSQGK